MSSYSSPIMLIPRKLTGIPRIVRGERCYSNLGASSYEVLSLADLNDAYYTLRLSKKS